MFVETGTTVRFTDLDKLNLDNLWLSLNQCFDTALLPEKTMHASKSGQK
jgi:hypothetical protein